MENLTISTICDKIDIFLISKTKEQKENIDLNGAEFFEHIS